MHESEEMINRKSYALYQDGLGLVFLLYLPGQLFRSVSTGIVVHGQLTPFSSEFLRYKSA